MKKKIKKIIKKKVAKKVVKPIKTENKTSSHRIRPLADRVLVRPLTEQEARNKSSFGIILPESVSKEKSAEGIVLAVGEGKFVEGKLRAMNISVGDRVLFSKYGYDEVSDKGEDLYILKEDSILAVIGQ